MKQVNFDALRQIKAPEELITRTVKAVQESTAPATEYPKAVIPMSRWRRMAVAASVVLIFGVSLFVYFQIRNINDVPSPAVPATEGTHTPADAPTNATGDPSLPDEPTLSGVPTEPATGDPTELPTAKASETPTAPTGEHPTAPTAAPTQGETTPPVIPTEPASIATQAPDIPAVDPTEPPPPVEEPTELTTEWPGSDEPPEPTESPIEAVHIRVSVPSARLTGSGRVYCTVYSSAGVNMLPGDPFSADHLARSGVEAEGVLWAIFAVTGEMTPRTDTYTVVFYNEDGQTVCSCQKTIYAY